jgi:hypothetical protein
VGHTITDQILNATQGDAGMRDGEGTISVFRALSEVPANPTLVAAATSLTASLNGLFEFPVTAVLLWDGCVRQMQAYSYPQGFDQKWRLTQKGHPDARMGNGPPNAAFKLASGTKPPKWELDHIYDDEPLWAARGPRHFTQSAGLVAMPRHVHLRRPKSSSLSWLLRGIAFSRFGYDPMSVFSDDPHDGFGFVIGSSHHVFWP